MPYIKINNSGDVSIHYNYRKNVQIFTVVANGVKAKVYSNALKKTLITYFIIYETLNFRSIIIISPFEFYL